MTSPETTKPLATTGTAQLQFNSEHRLRSENLAFDIDVWYPLVSAFTARSVFLPLTRREAEAIKAFHDVSWRNCRPALTEDEVQTLRRLERDLDASLRENFTVHATTEGEGEGEVAAFVRLCGRSPKDGDPLDFARMRREYTCAVRAILSERERETAASVSETEKVREEEEKEINVFIVDPLVKLQAMARVSALKVRSGCEVMSLLLTSERVYADMLDWTRYGEPEQVVLRAWNDEMTLDYEFRVFVYKSRVTAISQYDHYAHYAHLEREKDMLQEGLLRYWRDVHAALTKQPQEDTESERESHELSCVADIAYLPLSQSFVLVELSPFAPCTGAALFSWSADKALLEGLRPLEFRLKAKEELHPQLDDLLQWNWEDRWFNAAREPLHYQEYFQRSEKSEDENERQSEKENEKGRGIFHSLSRFMFRGGSSTHSTGKAAANTEAAAAEEQSKVQEAEDAVEHLLFVYGTLKRGFHWNAKYLSPRLGARFVGTACTVSRVPLVIGDCGVPYLLGDHVGEGERVRGELWVVSATALRGLDEYEGIAKGYYSRRAMDVSPEDDPVSVVSANVYVLNVSTEELIAKPALGEYPLTAPYRPIEHIQVKQHAYYGELSSWGKTSDIIATEHVTN